MFCSVSTIRQQTLEEIATKKEQSWVLSTYQVLFSNPCCCSLYLWEMFWQNMELGNFTSPASRGVSERLIAVNKTAIYSRTEHDENQDTDVCELPLVSQTRRWSGALVINKTFLLTQEDKHLKRGYQEPFMRGLLFQSNFPWGYRKSSVHW